MIVSTSDWNTYTHPSNVTVKLGDGSVSRILEIRNWECQGFDPQAYGKYIWEGELVVPEGLLNPKNLKVVYEINYIEKHYLTAALDVDALELNNADDFDATGTDPSKHTWPATTKVKVSSGETKNFKVEDWQPANGDTQRLNTYVAIGNNDGWLDPNVEGTYVFKGRVVPDEDYTAEKTWVFFRINYFKNDTSGFYQYQRAIENLDRGLYAFVKTKEEVIKEVESDANGVFVSWRILVDEYEKIANGEHIVFDLYKNGVLTTTLNSQIHTNVTSYHDKDGKIGDTYYVVSKQGTRKETSTSFTVTERPYLPISVQKPEPIASIKGSVANYSLNDFGTADVDGDGIYEIVVKWYPSNGFDSGKAERPSSPTIFDCYKMDGTPLWRLYMGHSMPSGAHFNQFIFYDLDQDGKAEFGIKTGDGTRMYVPNTSGKFDMNDESTIVGVVGNRELEGTKIQDNGHIMADANEYYTVFDGLTGYIIDTISYPHPTVNHDQWDDGWGNRSGRYNANVGYIPKSEESIETIPAIFENRGYYNRTEVAAITLRGGGLTVDWDKNIPNGDKDAGKGNHNTSVGDLDNDGFDEIVLGSIAIDHDGTILWSKNGQNNMDVLSHGDAIHVTAAFPDTTQLYVFTPQEDTRVAVNYALSNTATGARVVGHHIIEKDIGRGIMANITSRPGYEIWAASPNSETPDQAPIGGIYNVYGDVIADNKPIEFSINWRGYWDGDLLSELPESYKPSSPEGTQSIFKYNEYTNTMDRIAVFEGTRTNNYTKNTPGLAADIFGDWREELVVPAERADGSAEIRIYGTTMSTEYSIYSLMQDPVYRSAVAAQNSSYNQPPHLSYYLGEDQRDRVLNFELPTYNLTYTWEKFNNAIISPETAKFNKNILNQADVITTIAWNNALYITDIKNKGESIGAEAYVVDGNTLTIKKEYLALQPVGSIYLTVEFDQGSSSTFVIYITDSDIINAVISPDTAIFDKNTQNQMDVETFITWNNATSVTDIKHKGQSIGADAYAVSGSAITGIFISEGDDITPANDDVAAVSGSALIIKKEYLTLQEEGKLLLTVEFDKGDSAPFVITITDTTPPQEKEPKSAVLTPVEIQVDKNTVRLQDIRTSITWNDAKAVMDVKKNGVSIGAHMFTVTGNTLTIRKELIAMEPTGTLILTVEFDKGGEAYLIITITDSTPVTVPESTTPPPTIYQPQIFVEQATVDGIERAARITITKADKDGVMKAVIELSAEEILAAAEGKEQPLNINLSLSTDKLLEEAKANDTKTVAVTVKVPDSLSNSKKINLNMELDLDLLKAIKEFEKTLTVSVTNQGSKELYSWTFNGKDLAESKKELAKVSLSLKVAALSKELRTELQKNQKDASGFILDFNHTGPLPAQAAVKIDVGNEKSIKTGDKIYLYHYNETTGKLETLPYSSNYQVDEDGYITIHILHCSDYVVLPKEADKSIMSTLRNQVSVTVDSTVLYVGDKEKSVARTKVELPNTLEIVKNIKDKTSNSNIGGVTVSYSSTNKKVAVVDSTGKITAVGKGTSVIIAKITLYSGKVKVVNMQVAVKEPGITMTTKTTAMKTGETFTFKAKASDGLDMKDAIWKTTEKSIVVIDKKTGVATAKSKGTDYVVVSIGNVSEKVKVVVK